MNKFDYTITNNIYNKVLTLPIEYHHTRPVGDVISRINDTSSIKQFINTISFSLILDVITIFLISIILFKINKIIFLILFIMSIIYSLTYFLHRKALKNNSILVKENASISNTLFS